MEELQIKLNLKTPGVFGPGSLGGFSLLVRRLSAGGGRRLGSGGVVLLGGWRGVGLVFALRWCCGRCLVGERRLLLPLWVFGDVLWLGGRFGLFGRGGVGPLLWVVRVGGSAGGGGLVFGRGLWGSGLWCGAGRRRHVR